MKLEDKPVNLRILRPETEDNWLTDGNTYGQTIYLADGASPDDWHEITAEEYEAAQKPTPESR